MTTALYRRYRPETFADVIGQEHVTEPLMQALRTGRVNHAYLFSGPRGCGKTTSARILARCLNCEQGPTPEPCGVCESCVALARGGAGSVDVIEIDAASHGGVDDARDLRERASFGPAGSRYKIYIIDEAHMVTPQGFNALLKIVEEPPEHVKFLFATTEPEKVIGTIRSRTHHYPFRLVPPQKLTDYMERLLQEEGVSCEPGVLSFVTRAGGGSVRDSLSVLDQLIAGSGPEGLTYAGAAALLGFTEDELLDGIIDAFAVSDAAGVFRQIDRVIEAGADPRRFVEDLLERLRDLIVVAAVEDGAAAVLRSVPADQLERMQQQASSFGAGGLSRAADVINAGLTEMSGATSPRLQLELMCARVLLPGIAGADGFAARLERMERRLEMGELPPGGGAGPVAHAPAAPPAESVASTPRPAPAAPGSQEQPSVAGGHEQRSASAPSSPSLAPTQNSAPDALPAGASASSASGPSAPVPQGAPPEQMQQRDTPPAGRGRSGGPGGMSTDDIRRLWPDVLDRVFRIKRVTWTLLSQNAHVMDFNGERLLLGASSEGLASTMSRGQHPEVVRQALVEAVGVDVRVEARAAQPSDNTAAAAPGPSATASAQDSSPHSSQPAAPSQPQQGSGAAFESRDEGASGQGAARETGFGSAQMRSGAGDPPAQPAPREASTPEQDEGLRAAAARSSAWASDSPGDWSSASGQAPAWALESDSQGTGGPSPAEASPSPVGEGASEASVSGPAADVEPPPDPESDIPPWMEDEPETDAQAVFDPVPTRDVPANRQNPTQPSSGEGRGAAASSPTPAVSRGESVDEAPQRSLTPRQRAEKAAREHAQRDEDARRGTAFDDASASPDDEDIENSDSVGLPVIKSILGGTVIKEEGPEQGS